MPGHDLDHAIEDARRNYTLVGGTENMRGLQSYETPAQYHWAGRLDAYEVALKLAGEPERHSTTVFRVAALGPPFHTVEQGQFAARAFSEWFAIAADLRFGISVDWSRVRDALPPFVEGFVTGGVAVVKHQVATTQLQSLIDKARMSCPGEST